MKFNVEFENKVTLEKWVVEVEAETEDEAAEIAEKMIGDQQFMHQGLSSLMFEVRPWF